MKHILYSYNPNILNNHEFLKIKTKLSSTIKRGEPWYILFDMIDLNLRIATTVEYQQATQLYKSNKYITDVLNLMKPKQVPIIGCGIPEQVFMEKAKLDSEGKCIDCSKIVEDYERYMLKLVSSYTTAGNVFLLVNDIHFRTSRSKEYGLPSKLINLIRNKSKFETFRPIKKEIL